MAKILIVDDSEMFREELREALEKGGHEVVDAYDGLNGLSVAKEQTGLDIVITDFNMPEVNGLQMVEELKKLEAFQTTPIFVLTTETSPELKNQAKKAGVMAWILKPFVPEKLLMGIDKVMKMKNAS